MCIDGFMGTAAVIEDLHMGIDMEQTSLEALKVVMYILPKVYDPQDTRRIQRLSHFAWGRNTSFFLLNSGQE